MQQNNLIGDVLLLFGQQRSSRARSRDLCSEWSQAISCPCHTSSPWLLTPRLLCASSSMRPSSSMKPSGTAFFLGGLLKQAADRARPVVLQGADERRERKRCGAEIAIREHLLALQLHQFIQAEVSVYHLYKDRRR